MSSSGGWSGSPSSWSVAAVGVLAGLGAGYALGAASNGWLEARRRRPPPASSSQVAVEVSGNLVAALVELTAEVARLRQAIESAGQFSRLPPSRRSWRGGASTADFVSAQEDNAESDDEFFDPNSEAENMEGEGEREGEGEEEESAKGPDYSLMDELGRNTQENQDACETLIEQIRTALSQFPEDVGLLWRLARTLFYLGDHLERDGYTEEQKSLVEEAQGVSQQAVEMDGGVWQAHQWLAITTGSLTKHEGTQRKIEMGYKFKEHIERAIELNPEERTLHHLRGRFCFEVAGVSWLEKKAAAALFGSPPESTYEEALESFMKAEEQSSGHWKMNALLIAKCHLRLSDVSTVLEWLHKAHNMPTNTPEDHAAETEVEDLLSQNDPNSAND